MRVVETKFLAGINLTPYLFFYLTDDHHWYDNTLQDIAMRGTRRVWRVLLYFWRMGKISYGLLNLNLVGVGAKQCLALSNSSYDPGQHFQIFFQSVSSSDFDQQLGFELVRIFSFANLYISTLLHLNKWISVSREHAIRESNSPPMMRDVLSLRWIDRRSEGVARLAGSGPKAASKSFFVQPPD